MANPIDNTIEVERKFAADGGLWTDENLNESLDWGGEQAGGLAGTESAKTHSPKTTKQIGDEILSNAGITAEVLATLAARVESKIISTPNSNGASINEMVEKGMRAESDKVQNWLNSQNKRLESLAAEHDARSLVKQSDIDRIDEKLRILEEKVASLITESTANKTEEFAIIHEASKILKDRRAVEELETDSSPSIINRIESRADQLHNQLRNLEPHIESSHEIVVTAARKPAAIRRKFGRTM